METDTRTDKTLRAEDADNATVVPAVTLQQDVIMELEQKEVVAHVHSVPDQAALAAT